MSKSCKRCGKCCKLVTCNIALELLSLLDKIGAPKEYQPGGTCPFYTEENGSATCRLMSESHGTLQLLLHKGLGTGLGCYEHDNC